MLSWSIRCNWRNYWIARNAPSLASATRVSSWNLLAGSNFALEMGTFAFCVGGGT